MNSSMTCPVCKVVREEGERLGTPRIHEEKDGKLVHKCLHSDVVFSREFLANAQAIARLQSILRAIWIAGSEAGEWRWNVFTANWAEWGGRSNKDLFELWVEAQELGMVFEVYVLHSHAEVRLRAADGREMPGIKRLVRAMGREGLLPTGEPLLFRFQNAEADESDRYRGELPGETILRQLEKGIASLLPGAELSTGKPAKLPEVLDIITLVGYCEGRASRNQRRLEALVLVSILNGVVDFLEKTTR